jgi:hypothetical protein
MAFGFGFGSLLPLGVQFMAFASSVSLVPLASLIWFALLVLLVSWASSI